MRLIHILAAMGGVVSTVFFLYYQTAAHASLDPDRTLTEKFRYWFAPGVAVRSDYTDEGWELRTRQRTAFMWMIIFGLVFVFTQ